MREVMLTADGSGMRLDKWLTEQLPELSRSGVQHLIEQGAVLCNGKPAAKNLKLREGDSLPPLESRVTSCHQVLILQRLHTVRTGSDAPERYPLFRSMPSSVRTCRPLPSPLSPQRVYP